MGVREYTHKKSGAIIFKKDREGKNLDQAMKDIENLQSIVAALEKKIKKLEKANKTSE